MTAATPRRVLLLGWEGADWQFVHPLLDAGHLPNLSDLIGRGVMGGLNAAQPLVSPLLANNLLTGKRPREHGVLGFRQYHADRVTPVTASTRQVPAIWDILSSEGISSTAVGWWTTHHSTSINGTVVSEFFGAPSLAKTATVLNGALSNEAQRNTLQNCWLLPEEIDTDTIGFFVPKWQEIDQNVDPRLALIRKELAHTISLNAAFCHLLDSEPWRFATVSLPALRALTDVFLMYMAPKQESIEPKDFEHYSGVIDAAYRFFDLMLGHILNNVDTDTTVLLVSTHGFRGLQQRPPAPIWMNSGREAHYRSTGIFVAAGSDIRHDELIHGVTSLDIAPTILNLFGLPIGRDMPGRVLGELFSETPSPTFIPSWDSRRPEPTNTTKEHDAVSEEDVLLSRYVGLGLLPAAEQNHPSAIHRQHLQQQSDWNLARSEMNTGEFTAALPLLESLSDQEPEHIQYALQLGECQMRLSLYPEARETLQTILDQYPDTALAHLAMARLESETGNFEKSLDHLAQAQIRGSGGPDVWNQIGLAHLRLRRWSKAIEAYEKVLLQDPDNAHAYLGKARALLGMRAFEQAMDAALNSISSNYQQPLAHYILALTLLRQRMLAEAQTSLELTLHLAPGFVRAHIQLLRLKRQLGLSEVEYIEHRDAIKAAGKRTVERETLRTQAHERQRQRADARAEQRRRTVNTIEQADTDPDTRQPMIAQNHLLVSGLPRCGASAVMAALEAGGMELMTDIIDGSGYGDWSELKNLPTKPGILERAHGKIIKISPILLAYLPRIHHYKILFVHRPIPEVAISQQRVLEKEHGDTGDLALEDHARLLLKHRTRILSVLRSVPNVTLLELDYPQLCRDPGPAIDEIREFLGADRLPERNAMLAAVDPQRYHVCSEQIPEDLLRSYASDRP